MGIQTIQLERLSSSGGTLRYEFSSTLDLFRRDHFMIEYEGLLPAANESIQAVPFAALMAPIAMAAGAKLVIPALDRRFAESLTGCQQYWKKSFPKWAHDRYGLETKLVDNGSAPKESDAILFSSGLDSLSTYAHNRAAKPHLLCILGADIPLSNKHFIAECRTKLFDGFAKKEGVGITYIHTDIRESVDLAKLQKFAASWYSHVQFGILYAGLASPVSYGRFSKVILASCSHGPEDTAPCGADPEVIRSLGWGGTRLEDQLHEVSRVGKVARFLKKDPSLLPYLRVCWEQFEKLNCSRCKKCLRTICELLVNSVDPNDANFQVDGRTLPALRKKMTDYYHLFLGCDPAAVNFWREIQKAVDLKTLKDIHGSKEFFTWLSGFEPLKKSHPPILCNFFRQTNRMKKKLLRQ